MRIRLRHRDRIVEKDVPDENAEMLIKAGVAEPIRKRKRSRRGAEEVETADKVAPEGR